MNQKNKNRLKDSALYAAVVGVASIIAAAYYMARIKIGY